MASKAECDKYAVELTQRFEELTKWAMTNWPNKEFPLLPSDFTASRREISSIIGPKLGDGDEETIAPTNTGNGQYRDMNPMPWP